MFKSLLVANRGEIACRVFRTARRLGLRTIAVYSEADANALHVREADEAVLIGPAAARDSYLDAAKVLAAAKAAGAEAIHPGYGFLSENADFAEAVIAAGLVWVGAPPSAIRAMGLKDAAKALMIDAGVPVTPGYMGEDQGPERLRAEADAIGYPVLIKAVAGGGGKGMRRVDASEDFLDGLQSCRREAAAAFGDDRVLIEKYILSPRHIEVQVFGDRHGNVVHLFERDCSLQRRHQKVIEEAPAPGMTPEVREAVCAAAVKAARAVGYVGAGTIEFIADASEGLKADRIWFMEMNTRLQVEHPVTEAITGQDLVEWQLRAAAGEVLPKRQEELAIDGWAMEARLYAENPSTGFLPSIGRLDHLRLPDGVRVDTGVHEGDEVTAFYDPMIAKLIVHAPTRQAAAAKLAEAAGRVEAWPVRTNAAFLARAAADDAFIAGRVDTGFIERGVDALVPGAEPSLAVQAAAAAALVSRPDGGAWTGLTGFRANAPVQREVTVSIAGLAYRVEAARASPGRVATVGGHEILFLHGEAWPFGPGRIEGRGEGERLSDGVILSPMPGKVIAIEVEEGQIVSRGQRLLTLEAMKMEHGMAAPFDGRVVGLAVVAGDQVPDGAVLVRIEAASD
ncbi:biotin carboxylase N-terminal domain-containing protein [Brevundimonas sp. P7753]|uniref:acetyl/propionyl/methylcrotonyl-CoA carboxylase subunit alpha n=1 Tax=Brevundimonas sp. P7753 TaxID=2726982 RepID=UPI0015BD3981|nr:biotin carboxylase N-terminal domain-containing protein [Brevundimonas sp. P7753]NWE54037.1 ATP-grasp domain-containing protein [Brevundimonas sp. P7753]